MATWLVRLILLALVFGQVVFIRRSLLAGVSYYLCAAPLIYFQTYMFGVWDPDRLCGMVLLAGCWVYYRDVAASSPLGFFQHPLLVQVSYVILATMVGSIFLWPVDAFVAQTAAYGVLRPFISIMNWLLIVGVGWWLGQFLRFPGAYQKASGTLIVFGTLLSLYGIYQSIAYQVGLPMTGMRIETRGIVSEMEGEVMGIYILDGEFVFRPNSLFGEPKWLGAACVVCIAILLSRLFDRRFTLRSLILLGIQVYTLWLTASTGAWLGGVFCLGAFFFVSNRLSPLTVKEKLTIGSILGAAALGVVVLVSVAGLELSESGESKFSTIFSDRIGKRLSLSEAQATDPQSIDGSALDILTVDILLDRPEFGLFGTGMGGIAYYIAERMGGNHDVVLGPNIGVVYYIANFGILGLMLLFWSLHRGLRHLWATAGQESVATLAYVGAVALVQGLICSPPFLQSFSIGLLLAADWLPHPGTGQDGYRNELFLREATKLPHPAPER